MADSVQVAAFIGGNLRLLSSEADSDEVVLALPLNRLISKILRVPAETDNVEEFVQSQLQVMSPSSNEMPTVSYETITQDGNGSLVIAAALPESETNDIAEALDAQKLSVIRIDALFLGLIRGIWKQLGGHDGERRIILDASPDCLSAMVIDGTTPVCIRPIATDAVLKRELMRLLLEAEDAGGEHDLKEIVCTGDETLNPEELAEFAPVRRISTGEDAALVGVAERSVEADTLNALPESWRETLHETRFKNKITRRLMIAGGVWLFLALIVFGVPFVFDLMTDHRKSLCKEHRRQYEAVMEMKSKVDLVRKYSDHARGALEIMKAVSDRLPSGIELDSWSFRRDEGVRISGLGDEKEYVWNFKDNMAEASMESADGESPGESVFASVELNGPSAGKGGKQKFDLNCRYVAEEEE